MFVVCILSVLVDSGCFFINPFHLSSLLQNRVVVTPSTVQVVCPTWNYFCLPREIAKFIPPPLSFHHLVPLSWNLLGAGFNAVDFIIIDATCCHCCFDLDCCCCFCMWNWWTSSLPFMTKILWMEVFFSACFVSLFPSPSCPPPPPPPFPLLSSHHHFSTELELTWCRIHAVIVNCYNVMCCHCCFDFITPICDEGSVHKISGRIFWVFFFLSFSFSPPFNVSPLLSSHHRIYSTYLELTWCRIQAVNVIMLRAAIAVLHALRSFWLLKGVKYDHGFGTYLFCWVIKMRWLEGVSSCALTID